MARHHPGTTSRTAVAALLACLALCAANNADAQAASGFNLSGLPLSPSLFPHPAPLTPDPGGAFTSPAPTMPVPPLARTTIPRAESGEALDIQQTAAEHDAGDSHAALDDSALDGVR